LKVKFKATTGKEWVPAPGAPRSKEPTPEPQAPPKPTIIETKPAVVESKPAPVAAVKPVAESKPVTVPIAAAPVTSSETTKAAPSGLSSVQDFCIHVDISSQPMEIRKFIEHATSVQKKSVFTQVLYHSSVLSELLWGNWSDCAAYNLQDESKGRGQYDLMITFVVKQLGGKDTHFLACDLTGHEKNIVGERKIIERIAQFTGIEMPKN
jgi:hypothetical protein